MTLGYSGHAMRRFPAGVVLTLVLIGNPLHAQGAGDDYLVWQDGVSLAWDDFRGHPDPESPPYQGAESQLSLALRFSCTNDVPNLDISAEFDRNRSWARPNLPTSLLEHEQVHFDIAELYVRRTRREFRNLGNPCRDAAAVRAIANRNNELSIAVQGVYDEETIHGTRPEAQAEWARRIGILLKSSGLD